jgi:hypothetical protein
VRDLSIRETHADGNVFSTVFRGGSRPEFFTVPARYLESACTFMSFNDFN